MQKQKNIQVALIGVLAFAVLFMSVGFAAYAQTLNINGTATVGTNKWSVHFKENSLQKVEGSVDGENLTLDDATTTANFKVKLNKPGDYYAFSVDVINDGTFDAILKSITMTQLTEAEAKLLKFSVSYNGTEYTSSATNIMDVLNYNTGNNAKNVIVRVEYRKDIAAEDLPATDTEVSLSVALGYEQG